jgi:hypothetical protein
MFLVFNQAAESHQNSPSFYFLYCSSFSVQIYRFSLMNWLQWDSDAFLFYCSQMKMDDYPNCTLSEDGWLCNTGRHRPGFPWVWLYVIMRLG